MYGAGAAWSRLFLPGAGADPSRDLGHHSGAGAAQKGGGSATLRKSVLLVFDDFDRFW